MYSRVHIPPYHRCTKVENFLPIICRDIPHFVNFILVYETDVINYLIYIIMSKI